MVDCNWNNDLKFGRECVWKKENQILQEGTRARKLEADEIGKIDQQWMEEQVLNIWLWIEIKLHAQDCYESRKAWLHPKEAYGWLEKLRNTLNTTACMLRTMEISLPKLNIIQICIILKFYSNRLVCPQYRRFTTLYVHN